jgi:uncharacterized protein (TIRG00374 family)
MKIPWRALIGVAIRVLLLWWAFKDVEWGLVWRTFLTANVPLVLLSVAVSTMIFPLRAIRWKPILGPVAPNVPFGPLWRATAVGFMANNTLPTGRVGELVRAYMLSRETTVPFSAAFASLVVDRVFDLFVVIMLLVTAMYSAGFPADTLIAGRPASNYAGTGVLTLVLVAAVLYAIVIFPDRLIGLFELFARRVAPRFEERGRVMLRAFAEGLSVLRHPGRFAVVFFWALAHWLTQCLAFWIMFAAVGIDAPFSAAMFVNGLIVFGAAIPAAPGYFGPFEILGVAGLKLYGVDESLAAAWALGFHVLSLIPIVLIGLYYLARSGMKLGDLKQIKQ